MTAFPEGYRPFLTCVVSDSGHAETSGHIIEAKVVAGAKTVLVALHDESRSWRSFDLSSVTLTGFECSCAAAGRQRKASNPRHP